MNPRLEACWFKPAKEEQGAGQGDRYARLARVLGQGARTHCPDWEINIEEIEPRVCASAAKNPSHEWNTQKFDFWVRRALEAPDGARVLLIDGDTMILRPLDPVWELDFDLAYTTREPPGLPFNSGVVFLRISEKTREFMRRWQEANDRFLVNEAEHRPWRMKYRGINQASFGYMLEKANHGCTLATLPCSEWNLCEWGRHFDEKAVRIVHIKSGLRRAVMGLDRALRLTPPIGRIISKWREADALASPRPSAPSAPLPPGARAMRRIGA